MQQCSVLRSQKFRLHNVWVLCGRIFAIALYYYSEHHEVVYLKFIFFPSHCCFQWLYTQIKINQNISIGVFA